MCHVTAKPFPQHHRAQQQQQHHPELRGTPAGARGCWVQHPAHVTAAPAGRRRRYSCETLAEGSSYFIPQIEPNEFFCSQTFRVLLFPGKRQK